MFLCILMTAVYFLPVITGNNDRNKTPPDKNVASMTRLHCNQPI